jgi:sugar phosphate isomerase/epimerase
MRLGFSPVTAGMLDVPGSFRLAESLGLAFVELSFDLHEVAPALQDATLIAELVAATGVGVTVHLSYVDLNLASLIPAARRTSVDRTLRGLDYAHRVGAHCGVLHSGLHYLPHPQAEQLVTQALEASLGELALSSVPIALENLVLTDHDFVRGPRHLHDITTRHGMQNCLDFGHAHVEGLRDGCDRLAEYRLLLGERVIHLHVHDNDGSGDAHLPVGEGTIDYAAHADFLAAFTGTVCLEVRSGEEGVRASVSHLRRLLEVTA